MKWLVVITFLLSNFSSFGQKDYSLWLLDDSFKIPGLDTDITPTWNVGYTVLLLKGYDKGSVTFTKKGKLLMQQDYSSCDNTTFREGIILLSTRYRRYKASVLGTYTYDAKEHLLILNIREKTYNFKVLRHCGDRMGFEGFELELLE